MALKPEPEKFRLFFIFRDIYPITAKLLRHSFPLVLFFQTAGMCQSMVPQKIPGDLVITHSAYSIDYSIIHKQTRWDYYVITKQRQYGKVERKSTFSQDPSLPAGQSAKNSDYKGSHFDRGHLAPADDMTFSKIAMEESFFLTNTSPQVVGFNRGIWKRLEMQVHSWKDKADTIHVITGGHVHKGLPKLNGSISIPNNFYKIIIARDKHANLKAIAFLIPNEPSKKVLSTYLITIDDLEKLTKIDFCYKLPESVESKLESEKADLNFWGVK